MKVEIWSDFVCPFCYLGKTRFEKALEDFPNKDDVEIVYRSFELDPKAKKVEEGTMSQLIAKKYGITVEQAKKNNESITTQAKEVGLTYNLENAIAVNTLQAHRLFQYGKNLGKDDKMMNALFYAYFTENKNLSDIETLVDISKAVGLKEEGVRKILNSEDFTDKVREDEKKAQSLGVRGVPYFLINDKYIVSGAQPIEVFKETLDKVWEQENK